MTEDGLPLAELLAKAGGGDFLRSVAEAVVPLLMEADGAGLIGAGRHERGAERAACRNGYRDRSLDTRLDTRLGSLQLRIPKLRQGGCFPSFLEPRRTTEKALVAVIQEAWTGGVSTRRVDDRVQAMSRKRLCRLPLGCLASARARPARCARPSTTGCTPFWTGRCRATGPVAGRDPPQAARGRPERLGCGDNRRGRGQRGPAGGRGTAHRPERGRNVLGGVPEEPGRGLRGTKLVLSDAQAGLKAAMRRVRGATWQRCRVHWMRPALAYVPKGQQSMASLRQAFGQEDAETARQVWRAAADAMRQRWPRALSLRETPSAACSWTTASTTCWPAWASPSSTGQLHSTSPLERLSKEVKRRADVVGLFPSEQLIIRLIGAVLLEQNDERQLQHRSMQVEGMAGLVPPTIDGEATPFPPAPITPKAA